MQVVKQLREFKNLPFWKQQELSTSKSKVAALHYALKAMSEDLLDNNVTVGAVVGVVKKVQNFLQFAGISLPFLI